MARHRVLLRALILALVSAGALGSRAYADGVVQSTITAGADLAEAGKKIRADCVSLGGLPSSNPKDASSKDLCAALADRLDGMSQKSFWEIRFVKIKEEETEPIEDAFPVLIDRLDRLVWLAGECKSGKQDACPDGEKLSKDASDDVQEVTDALLHAHPEK